MFTSSVFQTVASLFVILLLINNVVQGRVLHFRSRADAAAAAAPAPTRTETALKTLGHAGNVLAALPPEQVAAVEKAVAACLASKNDALINKLVLKTLSILDNLNWELAQYSADQPTRRRLYDLLEDLILRDVNDKIDNILGLGTLFLDRLTKEQLVAYKLFYKQFENAPDEVKSEYFRIVIKYANKCAAGQDFSTQVTANTAT